ncbi:hypothetical protein GLAREA_03774 [Glarea lozoyensis ATCC 20868]|uniref:Uncharacterized protein n=1 Tax=Glarea lozoyensis (strain ATCC 20868 / MF5171) TaxID=1116229 RepID=S3CWU3_GLAL2|nr:uncharacterized protein GLAREA_03774 [Glarea lozoyensis ATCC 20868]EPE30807.1 hypothetical protein GLAREA_03774 [Glarea lozoyensis ATCC 20868]
MNSMPSKNDHGILHIVHGIQFCNILGVLGISAYRMTNKTLITTRSDTMAMGVAAKALVIMAYMIWTQRCQNLKKWSSIKASFILACTEIIFWAAAIVLPITTVGRCHPGIGCILSYIIISLAAVNCVLALPIAFITWRYYRYYKQYGVMPGSRGQMEQVNEVRLEEGSDSPHKPVFFPRPKIPSQLRDAYP